MVIALILIGIGIILVMIALFITEDYVKEGGKLAISSLGLVFFGTGICGLGYNKGEKDGAYNQLRGNYEITYTINSDSCVIDTIITTKGWLN